MHASAAHWRKQHKLTASLLSQSAAATEEQNAALAAAHAEVDSLQLRLERLQEAACGREAQLLLSHAEEVGRPRPVAQNFRVSFRFSCRV